MDKTQFLVAFFFCAAVCGILAHPGRPALPDSPEARKLFLLAEQNRTQDGFITKAEIQDIFVDFDLNMDGAVDEAEFLNVWMTKHLGTIDKAVTLFHHADTDRDDVITMSPDMGRLFYYFDRNQDGEVSQAEFVTVWIEMSL